MRFAVSLVEDIVELVTDCSTMPKVGGEAVVPRVWVKLWTVTC